MIMRVVVAKVQEVMQRVLGIDVVAVVLRKLVGGASYCVRDASWISLDSRIDHVASDSGLVMPRAQRRVSWAWGDGREIA